MWRDLPKTVQQLYPQTWTPSHLFKLRLTGREIVSRHFSVQTDKWRFHHCHHDCSPTFAALLFALGSRSLRTDECIFSTFLPCVWISIDCRHLPGNNGRCCVFLTLQPSCGWSLILQTMCTICVYTIHFTCSPGEPSQGLRATLHQKPVARCPIPTRSLLSQFIIKLQKVGMTCVSGLETEDKCFKCF